METQQRTMKHVAQNKKGDRVITVISESCVSTSTQTTADAACCCVSLKAHSTNNCS